MLHLIKIGFAVGLGLALAKILIELATWFLVISYVILVPEGTAGLGL
jgi:hypothetical protein